MFLAIITSIREKYIRSAIKFAVTLCYLKSRFRSVSSITSSELHIRNLDLVIHVKSATLSWFCHYPYRLILPTRSFTTHPHLIFFCRLLYQQSLSIHLCERYSKSQPIRSRIWLCFIPCQLQIKLTGMLGWLFGAWRTLVLGFQCIDFYVNINVPLIGSLLVFSSGAVGKLPEKLSPDLLNHQLQK